MTIPSARKILGKDFADIPDSIIESLILELIVYARIYLEYREACKQKH